MLSYKSSSDSVAGPKDLSQVGLVLNEIERTVPFGHISVVIRVRNEACALSKVLDALGAQDVKPMEVIVVDNASSDHTRAVAERHHAKIITISKEEFTHGRALNWGIRHARGEFVCILSAHSLPIGPGFLRNAITPFADCKIAAVRCLSVTSRAELENWTIPTVLEWPVEIEQVIAAAPVNSAAVIRRAVWERIPYDEALAGVEDKFWAFEVLRQGYRICNSAAEYLYLRDLKISAQIRKLNSDRVVFFKKTGRQWQEPPVSLRRLVFNAFYAIPRRAIRAAIYEAMLYTYLRTVPLQARRRFKPGSLI